MRRRLGEFGCPKAQACLAHMARSPEQLRSLFRATNPGLQGCGLLNVCHAYRNATLGVEHVSKAIRGDEAVEAELASSNLCGALDFSQVDDVCGRLETPEILMKKAAHDARCAHRGPGAQPRVADESIGGLFSRLRGA